MHNRTQVAKSFSCSLAYNKTQTMCSRAWAILKQQSCPYRWIIHRHAHTVDSQYFIFKFKYFQKEWHAIEPPRKHTASKRTKKERATSVTYVLPPIGMFPYAKLKSIFQSRLEHRVCGCDCTACHTRNVLSIKKDSISLVSATIQYFSESIKSWVNLKISSKLKRRKHMV